MADGGVAVANPANEASGEVSDADGSGGRTAAAAAVTVKWPGWPGDNVFRLIVPVLKVGSIIGKKGELIKKMCDDTRARIRVLDAPIGTPDRIVLISGKEDLGADLPPAMDAAIRVFKRVTDCDAEGSDAAVAMFCSIRLLVSSSQAINLIGKQGSTIKSIQESSSATVRVLTEEECPSYANSEERIVEIHGESVRVLKALESILGHLRKFLVDHSVLPVFEKTFTAMAGQDRKGEMSSLATSTVAGSNVGLGLDYSSLSRDASFLDRDSSHFDPKYSRDGLSLFSKDTGLDYRPSGRTLKPIITQMTQTMQVPLSYAESIIGINGANIAYIRRSSGAILTVQESRGVPDEITVEVKGSSSQVQMAQNLIQEFISGHGHGGQAEGVGVGGGMGNPKMEGGMGSLSRYSDPHYPSSAYTSHLSSAYSGSLPYTRYSSGSAFRF